MLALAFAAFAPAQTTLTFNDLPNSYFFSNGGQNIGTYYPGITFGPNVTALSVSRFGGYNSAAFPPQSGDVVIWDATDASIAITFALPVPAFSIWYTSLDPVSLQAYDQNNNLLGTVTGPANTDGFNGSASQLEFSNPATQTVRLNGTAGLFTLSNLAYGAGAATGPTLAITSLAPASGVAGGPAFTLTVNGSGFGPQSVVGWNSTAIATTYVSSSQVTAGVPAALIASPGSASVQVFSNGQYSNTVPFAINAASTTLLGQLTIAAGNRQSTGQSQPFAAPIAVRVLTAAGNPAGGASVQFAVTSGNATLGTSAVTTDNNGLASTTVTAGSSLGGIGITVTAGSLSTLFSLAVVPPASFSFGAAGFPQLNVVLPDGTVGAPYAQSVAEPGWSGYYNWAVTAGALPPGLSLGQNGVLSGTPNAAGSYTFTLTISDSVGDTDSSLFTVAIAPATANPAIWNVQNAYRSAETFGGAIAPGELIVISAGNIGATGQVSAAYPLPTQLANVQVLIEGVPAFLTAINGSQIQAIAPYAITGLQAVSIQLKYGNAYSPGFQLTVVESAPGVEASGAQAVAVDANLHPITAANPASPGQTVTFYISGGGQLLPAGVDNGKQQVGSLVSQVTATIGGQSATVIAAGTSLVIGAGEVSVIVPSNAPAGSDAVVLTVGFASTQSGISISVN